MSALVYRTSYKTRGTQRGINVSQIKISISFFSFPFRVILNLCSLDFLEDAGKFHLQPINSLWKFTLRSLSVFLRGGIVLIKFCEE